MTPEKGDSQRVAKLPIVEYQTLVLISFFRLSIKITSPKKLVARVHPKTNRQASQFFQVLLVASYSMDSLTNDQKWVNHFSLRHKPPEIMTQGVGLGRLGSIHIQIGKPLNFTRASFCWWPVIPWLVFSKTIFRWMTSVCAPFHYKDHKHPEIMTQSWLGSIQVQIGKLRLEIKTSNYRQCYYNSSLSLQFSL